MRFESPGMMVISINEKLFRTPESSKSQGRYWHGQLIPWHNMTWLTFFRSLWGSGRVDATIGPEDPVICCHGNGDGRSWSLELFWRLEFSVEFLDSPKNPDPSYGNTRPSVHDTPGAFLYRWFWHPMTSHGALGSYYSGQIESRPHTTDLGPQVLVVFWKGNGPRIFQTNRGW